MQYWDFFITHYGWQGFALALVIIVLLGIQIYYYVFAYAGISKYRNDHRPRRIDSDQPAISVIVTLYNENSAYLERGLLQLLSQEYPAYEVVVVYVGSDNDFYEDLARMKLYYPNLRTTKIEAKSRFPISPKMAINVGIKSAHNEHIILTTPEAEPRSNRWMTLMAKGFTRGDIVLGYCSYEHIRGFSNYLMRAERFGSAIEWISAAIRRQPYRGDRNNIGFTKSLYFGVNGFGNLNMNTGVDDLFMQQIMTRDNVSIVLSPRASMSEKCWGGVRWWLSQRHHFDSTHRFYPAKARSFGRWERVSRLLLFIASATALAVMPLEYKIAVGVILLLRYVLVITTIQRICKRLGERGIVALYPLHDLFAPLLSIFLGIIMLRKDPSVWR
jgi:hypothetical protein